MGNVQGFSNTVQSIDKCNDLICTNRYSLDKRNETSLRLLVSVKLISPLTIQTTSHGISWYLTQSKGWNVLYKWPSFTVFICLKAALKFTSHCLVTKGKKWPGKTDKSSMSKVFLQIIAQVDV